MRTTAAWCRSSPPRDHIRKIVPLTRRALGDAGRTLADVSAVAYTAGPGLLGALMVGAGVGRSLAWALRVPALAVHHMEAHLLAPLIDAPSLGLPFVALLVSGGHTQLVKTTAIGRYELLGESLDDAAGEAFDKTAKVWWAWAIRAGRPSPPKLKPDGLAASPCQDR